MKKLIFSLLGLSLAGAVQAEVAPLSVTVLGEKAVAWNRTEPLTITTAQHQSFKFTSIKGVGESEGKALINVEVSSVERDEYGLADGRSIHTISRVSEANLEFAIKAGQSYLAKDSKGEILVQVSYPNGNYDFH